MWLLRNYLSLRDSDKAFLKPLHAFEIVNNIPALKPLRDYLPLRGFSKSRQHTVNSRQ